MSFQIKIQNPPSAQKIADVKGIVLAMMRAMAAENQQTLNLLVTKYAGRPPDSPVSMEGLRTISGRLRNSYAASAPRFEGTAIVSDIGSNVEYAGILEFGGQTRAHDIVARNAKALAFAPGGKFFTAADFNARLRGSRGNYRALKTDLFVKENGIIFRRVVHHPGSNIPAFQPIQRSIEERLPNYAASMGAAAAKFANN